MTTFKGGPADGQSLTLKRRPVLLRVVQNSEGKIDALDMLSDVPEKDETVTVYILAEIGPSGFIDGRDKQGKRWGTSFASGVYRLCPFQPSEAETRSPLFEDWCARNESITRALHEKLIAECQ